MQIHPELEESAAMSGANWFFRTFRHIVLPLLRPGLAAGWGSAVRGFTASSAPRSCLYSPNGKSFGRHLHHVQEGGFRTLSAADHGCR